MASHRTGWLIANTDSTQTNYTGITRAGISTRASVNERCIYKRIVVNRTPLLRCRSVYALVFISLALTTHPTVFYFSPPLTSRRTCFYLELITLRIVRGMEGRRGGDKRKRRDGRVRFVWKWEPSKQFYTKNKQIIATLCSLYFH